MQWAKKLPDWQSDAVRRLLIQDVLTDEDEGEILAMLKAGGKIVDPESPAPQATPLEEKHVSGGTGAAGKTTLKRLKVGKNVNAIEEGGEILFGHEGITAIYGENAAGKSGYARILKRACRARDTKERILPDVFGQAGDKPATATISLSVDGAPDKVLEWTDGDESEELANVAVFDSKCARVIVNEKNETTYLPYGATVFEGLVSLLGGLRKALQSEKPAHEILSIAGVVEATKTAKWLARLSGRTARSR
ncbi:MAG: hypothetical protein IID40_06495 [Planctomycetes bacterium]|nr:hypothetical protein [Planctomycetota bacterium]